MRKQELIHLHGLLAEVGDHYEQKHREQINRDDYDSLGVRPTSIHKSKTDHKSAVFALANAITSELRVTEDGETVTATAD